MHSHSSMTTVSTFRERDIVKGPPSPPEVRVGLAGPGAGAESERDVRGAVENGNGHGHARVPPVVAPKPKGLQARLAGAVAAGTSGE
jgi:hypothetical protein